MSKIHRIHAAPGNLAAFIHEILPSYEGIYGPEAAQHYRERAPQDLARTITHPAIRCYAFMEGPQAEALLFIRQTATRHLLSFFHVLQGSKGEAGAGELLEYAVTDLEQAGNPLIVSEYLAFSPLQLDDRYTALGFQCIGRSLQHSTTLPSATAEHPVALINPFDVHNIDTVARVLADTYAHHPEQILFEEASGVRAASDFIAQSQAGAFGSSHPEYQLGAWLDGTCVGFALGSEVVAGLGFVLHMAVLPEYQGRGIGRQLLHHLTAAFARHGLSRVALGVTNTNPARYLYESAGFETLQPFPVYYRLPRT